jgi:hypothetical protein
MKGKKGTKGKKMKGTRVLFYSFGLRALFYASHFMIRIREFDELNFTFSVRVFTGSARDALTMKLGYFETTYLKSYGYMLNIFLTQTCQKKGRNL